MIRIFYRVLFVLFLISGLRAAAQSSDVALWIVDSELSTSTIVDEGEAIEVDFDEQAGYGFSFNRHWMGHFSTELALQKYAADISLGIFEAGRLRMTGEMKYVPWDAKEEGDVLDEAVEVDPVTFAAGVRFRF